MLTTFTFIAGAYLLVGSLMAIRSMAKIYSSDRHQWRLETLGLTAYEAERRARYFRTGLGFLRVFLLAQFAWGFIVASILWDSWREKQRLRASGLRVPPGSTVPTDATGL